MAVSPSPVFIFLLLSMIPEIFGSIVRQHTFQMTAFQPQHVMDRRRLLFSSVTAAGGLFASSVSAEAKELPVLTIDEGFQLLRKELQPEGGIYKLSQMVESEDWESILAYTKVYDLSFRKLTMKQVTNALALAGMSDSEKVGKELRDKFNYDLIALNKASRPQFRSIARASADADMLELKEDLRKFIALDPTKQPTLSVVESEPPEQTPRMNNE